MPSRIFNKIQFLSFSYLDGQKTGRLVSKYSFDTQKVQDSLMALTGNIVPTLVFSGATIIVLIIIDWRMSLVMLLLLPMIYATKKVFFRVMKDGNKQSRIAQEKLTGKAGEMITSVRMVRSLGEENSAMNLIKEDNDHATRMRHRLISINSHFGTFSFVTSQTVTLIVITGGAIFVLLDYVSMGTLVAFMTAIPQILMPINLISNLIEQFMAGSESHRSVNELLETPFVEKWNGTRTIDSIKGEIEFNNITFSYPIKREQKVFENFNLKIRSGEKIALVGPSGSGKSTIAQLLLGLYETQEGSVTVDDVSLDELDIRAFRKQCSIVMQDSILISGSVIDNLRFAQNDATDEAVRKAARLANADEFIQLLPEGYNTFIGEGGSTLSGGQKQRLSIARALLRNPKILILDEATSALDNESERLIHASMEAISEGRTVISIAHRLSTIRNADRIIILEKGKIIDMGTYDQLLAHSQYFKDM